ncbi:MAG TPA: FimV/HubP family polar landmark protein, partial [Afifellaceae bacterium]|nr:FimV/HubP family polar landmark protein [Afifellaceae bacterium]
MLTMRVNVDCAYTPRLSREYLLFLDPAGTALEPIAAPAAGSESVRPRETAAAAPKVDTIRPQPDAARKPAAPISTNGRYRVQRGDTLSEIAARIENRPVGLWDAVSALFEANPDAFINNDPNLLKAGSWLELPDFGSAQAVTVAERSSAIATDTSRGIVAAAAASPAAPSAGALPAGALPAGEIPAAVPPAYEPPADAAQSAPAAVEIPATETATTAVSAAADPTAVADADDPFVVGSDPEPVDTGLIPDTDFDIPASSSRPNVPTAVIRTPIAESSSVNWLFWLVGSGVALLIALV